MNSHWVTVYADYGCTELTRTTHLVCMGVLTVIDVVYVWVYNIWTMPGIIGHTRLIINGLIGKPITNCYNQQFSINNNDGPTVNFWRDDDKFRKISNDSLLCIIHNSHRKQTVDKTKMTQKLETLIIDSLKGSHCSLAKHFYQKTSQLSDVEESISRVILHDLCSNKNI